MVFRQGRHQANHDSTRLADACVAQWPAKPKTNTTARTLARTLSCRDFNLSPLLGDSFGVQSALFNSASSTNAIDARELIPCVYHSGFYGELGPDGHKT
jgi:hypothetical protein